MKISVKIFAVSIVAPIIAFTFFSAGICNAQDWTSSTATDTVYIKIAVRMIGASWIFNEGGTGPAHTAPALAFSHTADTFDAAADSATAPVYPCDKIHHIFWLENTGGITLDINAFFSEALSGPDWVHSDFVDTTGRGMDTLVGSYAFEPPDPTLSTDPVADWTVLPEDIGASDEYENLYAEDPTSPGDSTWNAGESDIIDFHILYVIPGSSTTIMMQHFYSIVVAKISD